MGGPLLGMRFGTLIKSVFALFANFELEKTDGKVLGREGDDDARPRSVLLGGGPGVAFYPFRHSVTVIKNIYIVGAVNLLIGGGGGIGAAGVGMNFETGYLIPASERINIGLAVGVDYLSTGGLNSDIKKELVIQTGIPYLEFRSRLICFNCASLSPSAFSFP